jgi:tetratricopeptide (TPR) repeat protein
MFSASLRYLLPLALLVALASPAWPQPRLESAQTHADRGFTHFYNLLLDEAAAQYQQAIALAPEHPEYHVGLAHVRMFLHLRSAGRLDAQIYGASNDLLPKPAPPDPQFERAMWESLARARAICEQRLAANANDLEAHYALGLAYAVESSFHVNARRKPRDALGPATKARNHHQRVRELDPANHDANFVVGAYEYAIGSVPAAFRWLLFLVGHSGSKSHGLELMEDAMRNGRRAPATARAALAYFYAREKQFARTRAVLQELSALYPQNHVFAMEAAMSHAREENHAAAAAAYDAIARKLAAAAPGFTRLSAPRLYFQIAVMYERAKDYPRAAAAFEKTLAALAVTVAPPRTLSPSGSPPPTASPPRPSSAGSATAATPAAPSPGDGAAPPQPPATAPADWSSPLARLRAHTLLRLGSLLATAGDKAKARLHLEQAAAAPFSEVSRAARSELRKLK